MNVSIPSIKKEKTYIRIVDTVIHLIVDGKLQYNDRLYTEQELMTILGVSRPTLREALRVLEFLGISEVRPHNGISICTPSDRDGYAPLLYMLAFEKTTDRELFELRQALQLEMTFQAAIRKAPDSVEVLYDIIAQMEQALTEEGDTFSNLDFEFHQQIIRIAGNRLILKLMNTIAPMIQEQLNEHNRYRMETQRRETLRAHRLIADEIAAGYAEAAREAMYQHLGESRKDAEKLSG